MFPNFNKDNKKIDQSRIDKNLKLMSISAVVLIVLFVYTIIKSDSAIEGTSYYIGVVFLFVLLILTFALQKYKDKIRAYIHRKNPDFAAQMQQEEVVQEKNTPEIKATVQSSDITPISSNLSFKDVAGIKDIKSELEEVVAFLNHPKKYQSLGVSLPKGVLLVGPPGVGKTLIAKAVAGEADVPFFYQSAASFVHIYVGMGAKRVRELFTAAKAKAPSIIFIDEIDAVGKERGIGSNDEREATLNELLTQMDGFESSSGVMVIAATNKIDVLDEALLRAGRFDRRVFLTLPSLEDRLDILGLYLKHKKYNFNIEKLASQTSGFSSAALSSLINEALLNMIKRDGTTLLEDDIAIAKQKIQHGKKQVRFLSEEQKDILATYQAGKAYTTKEQVKLFETGIIQKDLVYPSKSELLNEIKKYLSGSVALEIIKDETYVVFEEELKEAYNIATKMVNDYKMESDVESIIKRIKSELRLEFDENIDEVEDLKEKLLKEEVVF